MTYRILASTPTSTAWTPHERGLHTLGPVQTELLGRSAFAREHEQKGASFFFSAPDPEGRPTVRFRQRLAASSGAFRCRDASGKASRGRPEPTCEGRGGIAAGRRLGPEPFRGVERGHGRSSTGAPLGASGPPRPLRGDNLARLGGVWRSHGPKAMAGRGDRRASTDPALRPACSTNAPESRVAVGTAARRGPGARKGRRSCVRAAEPALGLGGRRWPGAYANE